MYVFADISSPAAVAAASIATERALQTRRALQRRHWAACWAQIAGMACSCSAVLVSLAQIGGAL